MDDNFDRALKTIGWVMAVCIVMYLLSSCGAYKNYPGEMVESRDSIKTITNVIYRDSLVFIEVPGESASSTIADTDTSHLESSIAISDAWVSDGRLHHTLSNKSNIQLPKYIKIPSYVTTTEKYQLTQIRQIVEVEKELTRWQLLRITLGDTSIMIILILLIIKIIKKKFLN